MMNKSNLRFHWLCLYEDLLGNWCVRKIYGSLNNNLMRDVVTPYNDKYEASNALTNCELIHRKRGYVYIGVKEADNFALIPQTINEVISGDKECF